MDEKGRQTSSYQLDQDILDARGINMTVQEVAGLPTLRYTERVHSMQLSDDDMAFLKSLRRRIKNRLASQNSRRRNMEHLRQLSRELRVVRQCKGDALLERNTLLEERRVLIDKCRSLREHIQQNLKDTSDMPAMPLLYYQIKDRIGDSTLERSKKYRPVPALIPARPPKDIVKSGIFECRIDKIVQQSINHIYKETDRKIVSAKTIFISDRRDAAGLSPVPLKVECQSDSSEDASEARSVEQYSRDLLLAEDSMGVLNLSVKQSDVDNGGRRGHGRKQTAPRRITYLYNDCQDYVLDLKVNREGK